MLGVPARAASTLTMVVSDQDGYGPRRRLWRWVADGRGSRHHPSNSPEWATEDRRGLGKLPNLGVAVNAKGFRSGLMNRSCLVELQAAATNSPRMAIKN